MTDLVKSFIAKKNDREKIVEKTPKKQEKINNQQIFRAIHFF